MTKAPIFTTPEPSHYSDYGFDPQINYFQVLEEKRRHSKRSEPQRAIDSLRFKLQKPISKDEHSKSKKRRRWWKSALGLLWKRPKSSNFHVDEVKGILQRRSYHLPASTGAPIYATESGDGAGSGGWVAGMHRRTIRPSSGLLMAEEVGAAAAGVAYFSLKDLSLVNEHRVSAPVPAGGTASSPVPIYLVT